jgi:hypothetical protein
MKKSFASSNSTCKMRMSLLWLVLAEDMHGCELPRFPLTAGDASAAMKPGAESSDGHGIG